MAQLDVLIFSNLIILNELTQKNLKCCRDAFEVLNILLGDNYTALEQSIRSVFSGAMLDCTLSRQ